MTEEINQLNELLHLCRNAEKGYQTAARQVEDHSVANKLSDYSRQRNAFAYELEQQIRIHGGDPEIKDDLTAGAHRVWIKLKGILSGEDAETIIRECLRGEQESINHYEKVMNETTFPSETRMLLAHQVQTIKIAVKELKAFL
jgi:uncharacterized protein (TIGR02284 family)